MNIEKPAVIAVTEKGARIAETIADGLNGDLFISEKSGYIPDEANVFISVKECFHELFGERKQIVAVMAQGIVTRMLAPLAESKYSDPAIVTCDEVGRTAISTMSGHEGGANKLAYAVSSITGAEAVITTATEANRLFVAGIGCRKGTGKEEIIEAVNRACRMAGITTEDIRHIASAWVKSDEQGLLDAADELGLYIRFLPKPYFDNCPYNVRESAAMKHFGIKAVAEPSALMSARNPSLVLPKTIIGPVTIALVKERIFGINMPCKNTKS